MLGGSFSARSPTNGKTMGRPWEDIGRAAENCLRMVSDPSPHKSKTVDTSMSVWTRRCEPPSGLEDGCAAHSPAAKSVRVRR